MAVGQIRAIFGDILLAVRQQIVSGAPVNGENLDDSAVVITARPETEVPHATADRDVLLRPLRESPDREVIAAAGRVANLRMRKVRVTMRTRVLLDQVGQDVTRLTDVNVGHLALEDAVCNALEMFCPADASGNQLVTEPVRLGELSEVTPERAAPEWVTSSFELEISYLRNLDQSIQ